MNAKHQRSKLLKTFLTEFEAWGSVFRFLIALKSNDDFDGFFSRQNRQKSCSDFSFHRELYPCANKKPGKITKGPAPEHRLAPANRFKFLIAAYFLLLTPVVWAHGGVSVNVDNCRIPVDNRWVHFTAYTPEFTQDTEYCKSIPNVGRTNLVFDYESRELRNMTVEFEITKEPEGTRVYHQDPEAHKRGSVNAIVDFNEFGPGKYLAHVTLANAGSKIDAHLPFAVASTGVSSSAIWLVGFITLAGLFVVFRFRPKLNQKISRIHHAGTPSS
jgi:hypothetical protein